MKALELKRSRDTERVCLSEDTGWKDEPIAVILYVPYTPESEHDHIELSLKDAKKINKWLVKFIKKHDK